MLQTESLCRRLVPCVIRDYTPADYEACKAAYESNVPQPFSEEYLQDCLTFLGEGTSYHLVLEHEGRVVGCGGMELRGEGPYAHLLHGCIHRDFTGHGFGSTLLAARLSLIEHEDQTFAIKLETGTDSAPFFAKAGFRVHQVRVDGCGRGRDSGILAIELSPEEIEHLRGLVAEAGVVIQLAEPELVEDEDNFES